MTSEKKDLITIKEASSFATKYIGKNVTMANILYLIQYGKVKKYGENGSTLICKSDLVSYYESANGKR